MDGLSIVAGTGAAVQYFVLRVDADRFGSSRDELNAGLRELNMISRRYFYPLCSDIPPYSTHPSAGDLPVAAKAATECLALPFHSGMDEATVNAICDAIEWHAETKGAQHS
jgi:dTDP-4-amino-4,6-dideoxygalactose transaminase